VDLVAIDGSGSEGGGQVLRTALALSAATGRGFELTRIRAQRLRPGLQPQHLAALRAAALACNAEVHGGFDGSPDLRFVPHEVAAGEFSFDIGGAGAATLVLETVVPILALAGAPSRVSVLGGTHVARSPSYDFVARHWAAVVERLGIVARTTLVRAGFAPRGEGRIDCEVGPWPRPAKLDLCQRGALVAVRGVAGASRLRGDVAQRASAAARELLWEARRIETEWDVITPSASSPGSYLQIEAIFEQGRAAFAVLGERGQPPELMGERAARRLLAFADHDSAVVDPWLADQLAVPLALARGGGRLLTSEVSSHLERVAAVLRAFGVPAETRGRRGGPGELEVGRW
jgi:RNA 3'-terminal phosphate cyclase (ATP)